MQEVEKFIDTLGYDGSGPIGIHLVMSIVVQK